MLIIQGCIKMSDIVTGTVTGQVNDGPVLREIANGRRESSYEIGTVRRELAVDTGVTGMNIKDGTDTVKDQNVAFYIAAQQTNFQNATALAALTAGTNAQFTATQTAIELAQASNAAATALATAATQASVASEGEKTRTLILQQKIEDLRFKDLRGHGHGHKGCGCGDTKFSFGPPLGATVKVENA
jgi:hypothetical protein